MAALVFRLRITYPQFTEPELRPVNPEFRRIIRRFRARAMREIAKEIRRRAPVRRDTRNVRKSIRVKHEITRRGLSQSVVRVGHWYSSFTNSGRNNTNGPIAPNAGWFSFSQNNVDGGEVIRFLQPYLDTLLAEMTAAINAAYQQYLDSIRFPPAGARSTAGEIGMSFRRT